MSRNYYSHATASKIRACIKANPGSRAKNIAKLIGLRRETVNSYLYSKQSGALGYEVMQDENYGWHLRESLNNVVQTRKNSSFLTKTKQSSKNSSQPLNLYQDDYNTLNNNEKEELQQPKISKKGHSEQLKQKLIQTQGHSFMVLRTWWFWLALLLGGILSIGTLSLIKGLPLPSIAPAEKNSR